MVDAVVLQVQPTTSFILKCIKLVEMHSWVQNTLHHPLTEGLLSRPALGDLLHLSLTEGQLSHPALGTCHQTLCQHNTLGWLSCNGRPLDHRKQVDHLRVHC
jgi:hypothetical protein